MQNISLFKIIGTKSLSSSVVEQFIDLIVQKKLKNGDKLPSETELCKAFNVSRGTLREGLKSLENFGLINSIRGSGSYISKYIIDDYLKSLTAILSLEIDMNSIIDLLEIRKVLEGYAVTKATKLIKKSELQLMHEEIIKAENAIEDNTKFIEHDINFHYIIYKTSGNMLLPRIIEIIRQLYIIQQYEVINKPNAAKRAVKFHKEILKSISEKDSLGAKEKMINHLEDIEKAILLYDKNRDKSES